jgi:hypothetical protein
MHNKYAAPGEAFFIYEIGAVLFTKKGNILYIARIGIIDGQIRKRTTSKKIWAKRAAAEYPPAAISGCWFSSLIYPYRVPRVVDLYPWDRRCLADIHLVDLFPGA